MNKDIAMQWADALESGEYKQDRGRLRTDEGFCCLGVLCDLHLKTTGEGRWGDDDEYITPTEADGKVYGRVRSHACLTEAVQSWAGVHDRDGNRRDRLPLINGRFHLAEMNDAGATFPEIAKVIREQWEAL